MRFLSHGTRVPIVHRGLVFYETLNETLKVRIPQWLPNPGGPTVNLRLKAPR